MQNRDYRHMDVPPSSNGILRRSSMSTPDLQAGFHPASFGPTYAYGAAALGVSSSNSSGSLGMSISPPQWNMPNNPQWGHAGSFVGSIGAFGTSFGHERDRELEATYTKDFNCCGKRLNGLHELLEHYEEDHSDMAPDARMAAITAAQSGTMPSQVSASGSTFPPAAPSINSNVIPTSFVPMSTQQPAAALQTDVPQPPGMMDLEMDDSSQPPFIPAMQPPQVFAQPRPLPFAAQQLQSQHMVVRSAPPSPGPSPSPWSGAFRAPMNLVQPNCLPPSLLSVGMGTASLPGSGPPTPVPYDFDAQAKALKKAQRKAERIAAREEGAGSDADTEKRFPCPIEGCGKVYKQANGLKYHLTRSINSGHGNLAELGGIAGLLGEKIPTG